MLEELKAEMAVIKGMVSTVMRRLATVSADGDSHNLLEDIAFPLTDTRALEVLERKLSDTDTNKSVVSIFPSFDPCELNPLEFGIYP